MTVIREVEFEVPTEKLEKVIHYYGMLYEGKPNTPKFQKELKDCVSSLLSGHVPITLTHAYNIIPGLLKILPELVEHLDDADKPERTNAFIGWFAYNTNHTMFPDKLAGLLNDALADYQGPVYATDVFSSSYSEVGIVFTSSSIEQADADAYFEDMLAQYYAEEDEDFDTDNEDWELDE